MGVMLFQAAFRLESFNVRTLLSSHDLQFILAAESADSRLKRINQIEDPTIRYLVTKMLTVRPMERPSVTNILELPLVAAWNRLLNDSTCTNTLEFDYGTMNQHFFVISPRTDHEKMMVHCPIIKFRRTDDSQQRHFRFLRLHLRTFFCRFFRGEQEHSISHRNSTYTILIT